MSRALVSVRQVDESLVPSLIDLWITNRVEGGASPEAAQRLALEGSVQSALARRHVRAFVALAEDTPVGYLVLSDSTVNALVDTPCVAIDQLFVVPDYRRHGVARQLLAAAATYADRAGAEQIASNVPSQVRDANRFFARLGFTPTFVRRVTTTVALHRRLAGSTPPRYSLDKVLERRRSARVREAHQAAPAVRGA